MASNPSAARTSCRIVLKFDTELLWLCGYKAKLAWATSEHREQHESGLTLIEAAQGGRIACQIP